MTIEEEKQELMEILSAFNISIDGRTPFGLIELCIDLPANARLNIHYNLYYSRSLLQNGNKWL
jgi:hypothetical protein